MSDDEQVYREVATFDVPMRIGTPIFSFHGPTCSIHLRLKHGKIEQEKVIDANHHRALMIGERQPLVVVKDDELIVRTDWEAMLKKNTEAEIRGEKP